MTARSMSDDDGRAGQPPQASVGDEIAHALKEIGRRLQEAGCHLAFPPTRRRLYLRYAGFAWELAERGRFCQELALVDVRDDVPVEEAFRPLWPLLDAYHFPSRKPYDRRVWADMLLGARLGWSGLPDLYGSPYAFLPLPELLEVQFVYGGSVRQNTELGDRLPIVRAVRLRVPKGDTKAAVRALLVANLRQPLARFRNTVRHLAKAMLRPSFDVRLLTFAFRRGHREPCLDDPPAHEVHDVGAGQPDGEETTHKHHHGEEPGLQ